MENTIDINGVLYAPIKDVAAECRYTYWWLSDLRRKGKAPQGIKRGRVIYMPVEETKQIAFGFAKMPEQKSVIADLL